MQPVSAAHTIDPADVNYVLKKVTSTLELLQAVEPCNMFFVLPRCGTDVSKHVRNTSLIFIIYLTLQILVGALNWVRTI